jgi:uncharacterized membrane protein YhaH (DUF805 family)
MKSGLKNSFSWAGRASRSEYWFWVLGGLVIQMTTFIVAMILGFMEVSCFTSITYFCTSSTCTRFNRSCS